MGYGNCLDYLQRRGVLPFRVAPFCPVDDLILSLCAYLPFEQVLPGPRQGDWVPFPQAVEALTQRPGWDAVGLIMAKDTPALVRQAARSPRFQTLGLGCAAGVLDQQTQFAALTFRLPDSTLYLAFRGTDDTLVGWKECFAMSYAFPVPAQALAQDYLVQVAQRHPGRLRVGGHSKGGNLAVWAALHAPPLLRRRILRVTSHDGPGFGQDLTRTRAYGALAPRLVTYIPQASLVGTLLHQDPRAQIIQSHGVGTVGQHDPFSWTVRGTGFVSLPRRSRRGDRESAGFRGWVDALSPAEREEFTQVFFDLLAASRAETLSEFSQSWADSALAWRGPMPPCPRRSAGYAGLSVAVFGEYGHRGKGRRSWGAGTAGLPGGGPCVSPTPLERQGTWLAQPGPHFLGRNGGKNPRGKRFFPLDSLLWWGCGEAVLLRDTWPAALTAKGL
ncbi:MAG: Mbeg1-like protein [Evtepia gabavorous]